jgi:hypothetical protein
MTAALDIPTRGVRGSSAFKVINNPTPSKMSLSHRKKILIGCEFSGVVRRAMRARGHDAWSCDLLPAEDDSPFHIQGDVTEVLRQSPAGFWDLIILHPPCTSIALSGNSTYGVGMAKHAERLRSRR